MERSPAWREGSGPAGDPEDVASLDLCSPECDADEGCDTDGDGVLDIHETGTGTFVSATDTGTDPRVADTDGDGVDDAGGIGGPEGPVPVGWVWFKIWSINSFLL